MQKIVDGYRDARAELHKIERDRHVKVVHACEAGSRAWGFDSRGSDWDVRFIYVRPISSYLGLDGRRDVIDRHDLVGNGQVDICGWDVQKALRLAAKSNPQVNEFLDSPIQYHALAGFVDELRDIMSEFNPRVAAHHYANMARTQYETASKRDEPLLRRRAYLYCLRPIFAVLHLAARPETMPSVEFAKLMDAVSTHPDVRPLVPLVRELLAAKSLGSDREPRERISDLDAFVGRMLPECHRIANTVFDGRSPDLMRLEHLSVSTIRTLQV